MNPLFWNVSQTVLSCTHAAVRDFFFIVVNMTTELLLLNEQTHLSACVCAVWIDTSFSDFNSIAIIPLFSIHWKYFCATFCQSSLVFLGLYRPHLTPRCFSLRKKIIESRWNTDAKSIFPIEFAIGFNRNHNRKTKRLTNSHTDFHLSFNMFPTRTNVSGIGVACHSLFFT